LFKHIQESKRGNPTGGQNLGGGKFCLPSHTLCGVNAVAFLPARRRRAGLVRNRIFLEMGSDFVQQTEALSFAFFFLEVFVILYNL